MGTTRGSVPHSFETSNEDKPLFPDGTTKGDLIDYYERVADRMLPHVRGRIVTMHRFPDGIDGKSFYQKEVPDYFPDWIETVEVEKENGALRQLTIENAATLAWLANQGCVEIHVWPGRADRPHHPDRMIFDLDPSTDDFEPVRRAARTTRDLLDELGLAAYPMTTGSRGLHIVTPLDRGAGFDDVRDFARRLARLVVARDPECFTVEQRKEARGDRLFVDYLRNAYAQHGIAPYSVRARPAAPVATPLDWDEVDDSRLGPRRYTIRNLFRRLAQKEDPWKGIDRRASSIDGARGRLDELAKEAGDES